MEACNIFLTEWFHFLGYISKQSVGKLYSRSIFIFLRTFHNVCGTDCISLHSQQYSFFVYSSPSWVYMCTYMSRHVCVTICVWRSETAFGNWFSHTLLKQSLSWFCCPEYSCLTSLFLKYFGDYKCMPATTLNGFCRFWIKIRSWACITSTSAEPSLCPHGQIADSWMTTPGPAIRRQSTSLRVISYLKGLGRIKDGQMSLCLGYRWCFIRMEKHFRNLGCRLNRFLLKERKLILESNWGYVIFLRLRHMWA